MFLNEIAFTLPISPADRAKIIGFTLYTVSDDRLVGKGKVLKLTAQFYPLEANESRWSQLEIKDPIHGRWQPIARAEIRSGGWTALFRVANWDDTKDYSYRVSHPSGKSYGGIIRKTPTNKPEIVMAALSCNSNRDRSMRTDIVSNIKTIDPDILFFAGDQSYDHEHHLAAWLLFGKQFGAIIKDRPTITIPDDHDVGQYNLWGAGGKKSQSPDGIDGGYYRDPAYVQMVERAQTSHLPDAFDNHVLKQGIKPFYTNLKLAWVDFAIVEDRKFKTAPQMASIPRHSGMRLDHVPHNEPGFNPTDYDDPKAELLGQQQLQFLDQWTRDWQDVSMKAVLSASPFINAAHIHAGIRLHADLDSNGWPQSGRLRALNTLRKAFAVMIHGDQHLATVLQHGLENFGDGSFSFTVPSIVNYYSREWQPPNNTLLGDHFDGFGNRLTMYAVANPTSTNHQGAGFGVIRFRKSTMSIHFENWPRFAKASTNGTGQYAGWPITVTQEQNYGNRTHFLPRLEFIGFQNPVVRIYSKGQLTYNLRVSEPTFHPLVPQPGSYQVTVEAMGGEEVRHFSLETTEDRSRSLKIRL